MKKLGVNKRTAVNYASKLRKKGYLANVPGGKIRMYKISPLIIEKKGYSFYELLNKNSKIKIAVSKDIIIHSDKEPSVEEILARAAVSGQFRIVLASLGLFNKIKNWSRLKEFARQYNIERKIGALYEVARGVIRVKKMDERTKQSLLNSKGGGYVIKNVKTKDFKEIEKKWGVYIPFNKADLERYKE